MKKHIFDDEGNLTENAMLVGLVIFHIIVIAILIIDEVPVSY